MMFDPESSTFQVFTSRGGSSWLAVLQLDLHCRRRRHGYWPHATDLGAGFQFPSTLRRTPWSFPRRTPRLLHACHRSPAPAAATPAS